MKIKVIKRDGRLEDFNPAKIARVTEAAGLTANQARLLAATVAEWARARGQSKATSLEIRMKVIEELRKVNKYVANLFTWYQKTKNHT